jgi:SsrA-binding protein
MKIITKNKKAFHDYIIDKTFEAGIVLMGDEVKSLRKGNVNLTGTFATINRGELFLLNMHIGIYSHAFDKREDLARRSRKLLVHKKELDKLIGEIARKGVTVIPLSLYFSSKGKVKVELGIGKHKKAHQSKEEIRERDIQRETRREVKYR